MSYEVETSKLAERMATLIAPPAKMMHWELPLVNAARRCVRQLCRQVLAEVTGESPIPAPLIGDLATHPIRATLGLLYHDPTPLGRRRPDDGWRDFEAATSEPGACWRDIRRHAALAAYAWSTVPADARPRGDEAWSIIADVASLAEAAALLDRDLARNHPTAAESGQPHDRERDAWELALAGELLRRVAGSGALPAGEPLSNRRLDLPLRVRAFAHVPAGTTRLARLLRKVEHVRPDAVGAVSRSHARSLITAAKVLSHDEATTFVRPVADQLRDVAKGLSDIARYTRPFSSLESADHRLFQQMRELRAQWHQLEEHPDQRLGEGDRQIAARSIRPALEVVTVLTDRVNYHIELGQWLRPPSPGEDRAERLDRDSTARARLVDRVNTVASTVGRLIDRLPVASPDCPPVLRRPPRDILGGRLAERSLSRPPLGPST